MGREKNEKEELELLLRNDSWRGKTGRGIMFSFDLNEFEDTEVQCFTGNWKCGCKGMGPEESHIE